MKQGIHPDYHYVVFEDSSTGFKFLSGSTATSKETVKWEDGNEYPLIRVEVTSDSHPFYTGSASQVLSFRLRQSTKAGSRQSVAQLWTSRRISSPQAARSAGASSGRGTT